MANLSLYLRKDLADRKDIEMGYFKDIKLGIETTVKGMSLTLRHFLNARQSRTPISVQDPDYFKQDVGIATLQFPHESIAVPDNGRYQLDCEIDDCIVCDKCAKVCPVDCIDIEPIKSNGIIDYASDGSPIRLYAGRFDIDMAKCCFCGLCTTVCPTECLTMTNQYDFSVVDVADMNFEFSNLLPEQAEEKKKLYNDYVAAKEAFKAIPKESIPEVEMPEKKPKTTFKPTIRPVVKPAAEIEKTTDEEPVNDAQPKPAFKPAFKPVMKQKPTEVENAIPEEVSQEEAEKPKTSFKPVFKTAAKPAEVAPENIIPEETPPAEEAPKPRASFKPVFKTAAKPAEVAPENIIPEETASAEEAPKPRASFKPVFKTVAKPVDVEQVAEKTSEVELPAVEAVAQSEIIEAVEPVDAQIVQEEVPKPKPAFTPKFRAAVKPTEIEPVAELTTEIESPKAELVPTIEAATQPEIIEVETPAEAKSEESVKAEFTPTLKDVEELTIVDLEKPVAEDAADVEASALVPTIEAATQPEIIDVEAAVSEELSEPSFKDIEEPAIVEIEQPVAKGTTDIEASATELVAAVEAIAKPEETIEPEIPVIEEKVAEAELLPEPDTEAPKPAEPEISLFGDFAPKLTQKSKAKAAAKPATSQSLFGLDNSAGDTAPKETPKPKGKSAQKPPKQQSLFDFGSPEE